MKLEMFFAVAMHKDARNSLRLYCFFKRLQSVSRIPFALCIAFRSSSNLSLLTAILTPNALDIILRATLEVVLGFSWHGRKSSGDDQFPCQHT